MEAGLQDGWNAGALKINTEDVVSFSSINYLAVVVAAVVAWLASAAWYMSLGRI